MLFCLNFMKERNIKYSVEFSDEFDRYFRMLLKTKRVGISEVFENALAFYIWINRLFDEAVIECEPGIPWKLSLTKDVDGQRVIIKDIDLP